MSEKIVQLNEEVIKGQLKELVRGSVEETLNELLEAEAEKLTQAARHERNEQRQDVYKRQGRQRVRCRSHWGNRLLPAASWHPQGHRRGRGTPATRHTTSK